MQKPTKEQVKSFVKKAIVGTVIVTVAVGFVMYAMTKDSNTTESKDKANEIPTNGENLDPWSFLVLDKDVDKIRQLIGTEDDVKAIVESLDKNRFEQSGEPWVL